MPHPIQKPHPPIWIGGHSRPSLRRVARFGDGWQPVGATAASPLPPTEFRALLDELKRRTEAERRDYESLTIAFKAPSYDSGRLPQGHDRLLFTGEPGQIAEDIRAYQALGVEEVSFDFRSPPVSRSLERMHYFMDRCGTACPKVVAEVIPSTSVRQRTILHAGREHNGRVRRDVAAQTLAARQLCQIDIRQ